MVPTRIPGFTECRQLERLVMVEGCEGRIHRQSSIAYVDLEENRVTLYQASCWKVEVLSQQSITCNGTSELCRL